MISVCVLPLPFGALPANLFSTSAFTADLKSLSSLSILAYEASISSEILIMSANSADKPRLDKTDLSSDLFLSIWN